MIRKTRRFLRIFFSILVLIVGPYILIYFLINERGKDFLINILKKKNIEAEIGELTFSFPFRITLVDFGTKNISFIQAKANIIGYNPFTKSVSIDNLSIKGLQVKINEDIIKSLKERKSLPKQPPLNMQKISGDFSISINNIIIDFSSIIIELASLKPPLKIAIEDIRGSIKNLTYPQRQKIFINLDSSLRIRDRKIDGALTASGWVNWARKDMNLRFKAKEIDYFMFKEYYPPFWKPKNLEIREAYLSLDSHLVSKKDNLIIDYYIILNRIVFNEHPEDESKVKSLKTIIALFTQDGQSRIHLRYRTKMSKPEFKITSIGESMLAQLKELNTTTFIDSVNQLLGKTQETVGNGVKSIKGITIDPVLKGIQQAGEELLKNIKGIFGIEKDKDE